MLMLLADAAAGACGRNLPLYLQAQAQQQMK
jgi:hypothetical protein